LDFSEVTSGRKFGESRSGDGSVERTEKIISSESTGKLAFAIQDAYAKENVG